MLFSVRPELVDGRSVLKDLCGGCMSRVLIVVFDGLQPAPARVSLEAGSPLGWERYVGPRGQAIGVDHFGASAPIEVLYEKFGLTSERVVEEATKLLG